MRLPSPNFSFFSSRGPSELVCNDFDNHFHHIGIFLLFPPSSAPPAPPNPRPSFPAQPFTMWPPSQWPRRLARTVPRLERSGFRRRSPSLLYRSALQDFCRADARSLAPAVTGPTSGTPTRRSNFDTNCSEQTSHNVRTRGSRKAHPASRGSWQPRPRFNNRHRENRCPPSWLSPKNGEDSSGHCHAATHSGLRSLSLKYALARA